MGATVNIQASTDCEVYLLSLNRLNQFWETDMNTQLWVDGLQKRCLQKYIRDC